ncbi:hypothetical protein [Methanococcus voltae]|jgi:hypothetical protein|uniref:Uncharacterized protein n=2 Tax=Methanococcus voltae TaxID=2188 RepID=A0A8J7RJX1_METVO|nr:hypothetical protein [Methanococcus voltae]MBP2173112.1 hypothetical protein [Methanococcus voltae]MBP2202256.1 hypothetical protein [Methanococcus voltae]MCS3921950.1 hypothetical protein [Methanococcus voltae PS]
MVTVEEYLKNSSKEVKLPSGVVFRIKTISTIDVIEAFEDPVIFAKMFNESENAKSGKNKDVGMTNAEKGSLLFSKIPQLVENNIVEPAGIKWHQLTGEDKEFLANEIVLKQLNVPDGISNFRAE